MKTQDFDYFLPPELIAQAPSAERDASRLLVMKGQHAKLSDHQFTEFVDFCAPGDLVVVNNTRVIPARLHCRKVSGGRVEVMLERVISKGRLLALVRANKPLKPGQHLLVDDHPVLEFVLRRGDFCEFKILNPEHEGGAKLFERHGEVPLPPYIKRSPAREDRARYQTVYAQAEGAVAAPTAGLHFNEEIFQRLRQKGVQQAQVTLHVGAGTFQPVRAEHITHHRMHQEWVEVSDVVVRQIEQTKAAGYNVIAVGTTTVRALECAAQTGKLAPFSGLTDIFIYPGYEFRVVDALLTNFHLPKSTLMMMISAFAGLENVRSAYAHAIKLKYRFFSYGDAMLLMPGEAA